MADNAAAKANFEELAAHIDLASKRVKALTPGSDGYNQGVEDLEDYYERTLQLRRMQAETALHERNTAMAAIDRIDFVYRAVVLALVVLLVAQFAWLQPELAFTTVTWLLPYMTVDRAILVFCVLFLWIRTLRRSKHDAYIKTKAP